MSNSKKERNQTPHLCETIGFSIANWFVYLFFIVFVFFYFWKRQKQQERSRGRELGGDRILSKLPTVSTEPNARLTFTKCENTTCAETKTQMLHWLSHPVAPVFRVWERERENECVWGERGREKGARGPKAGSTQKAANPHFLLPLNLQKYPFRGAVGWENQKALPRILVFSLHKV